MYIHPSLHIILPSQMPLRARLNPCMEYWTLNWGVCCVERVQHRLSSPISNSSHSQQIIAHLDVELPHIHEECPYPVIVFPLVEEDEFHV